MKHFSTILLLAILIGSLSGCKKDPEVENSSSETLIGGEFNFNHGYNTLCQTSDGGFVIAAPVGDRMIYVAKLNLNFDVIWQKSFGSLIFDVGGIIESSDQNYVLVCNYYDTTTHPTGRFIDLIKISGSGDLLWDKKYRFRYLYEKGFAIRETEDQGFIITAAHDEWEAQGVHFIELLKVNSAGDSLWSRDFPEYRNTNGHDIQITPDNGFITVGDFVILKTDSEGIEQWGQKLPKTRLTNVRVLPDGSYIACGDKVVGTTSSSNTLDFILMKFDANGNVLWEKLYDVNNHDWGGNLCLAPDGGFVFSGTTEFETSLALQPVIFKTDFNGNTVWMNGITVGNICEPRGLVYADDHYIYYGATTIVFGLQYYLMLLNFTI